MRLLPIAIAACLFAAACSSSSTIDTTDTSQMTTVVTTPTTVLAPTTTVDVSASDTTSSTAESSPEIPALLADLDVKDVHIGDRTMRLAIADSPGLRATGLMGVTDLGDLDGMLFYWRHDAEGGFWMKNTLIPLDIVWFDIDGLPVGRASMVPCESDPCPSYPPGDGVDYRFAIEANPGGLDWITDETVLTYED